MEIEPMTVVIYTIPQKEKIWINMITCNAFFDLNEKRLWYFFLPSDPFWHKTEVW